MSKINKITDNNNQLVVNPYIACALDVCDVNLLIPILELIAKEHDLNLSIPEQMEYGIHLAGVKASWN
jgi:hypothetical protein